MKIRVTGREITIKPRNVELVKTQGGCRIIINCMMPEDASGYAIEKIEEKIRVMIKRD